MTFREVVFKNLKGNLQQYLSYFLCSTYTITIFFMYSVLIFNDQIANGDFEYFKYIFPVAMSGISVFAVFFITYAHSSFIRGRKKEFGVYITLGMDEKELKKMVNLENVVISGAALISGIVVGTLFSRLFQMAILSLLQIDRIKFQLSWKPFLLTVLVFAGIFLAVYGITSIQMNRMDINSLLREARKSEGKKFGREDIIWGSIGFLVLTLSIVMVFVITNNDTLCSSPYSLLIFFVPGFFGIYHVISHGGNLLIYLLKKTNFYFRHLLEITEIHYKFSQNRKILFILSILSTMTITFLASPFSLLNLSASIADDGSHDIEYAQTVNRNSISEEKLKESLADCDVTDMECVPFLYLYSTPEMDGINHTRVVVSASEYNQLCGTDFNVQRGQACNVHTNWIPGTLGVEVGEQFPLYSKEDSWNFEIISSGRGTWLVEMSTFPNESIFIINDEEYQEIYDTVTHKKTNLEMVGYYHLIDVKDWKKSKAAVDIVKKLADDDVLVVNSVLDSYLTLKKGYSVFLFITSVLGILFFVAGGGVLYFKQFTELEESRKTFQRLFKIGITKKEMQRVIGNELRIVYFLPLVFGAIAGLALMYIMTFVMGGSDVIREFMKNSLYVIVVYFISQNAFYLITKRKYCRDIVRMS